MEGDENPTQSWYKPGATIHTSWKVKGQAAAGPTDRNDRPIVSRNLFFFLLLLFPFLILIDFELDCPILRAFIPQRREERGVDFNAESIYYIIYGPDRAGR